MDDFELIKRCCKGDKRAWDLFVDRFTHLIYDSIIRSMNKYGHIYSQEEIDDLHNDIFYVLIKNNYKALRLFEGRRQCQLSSYLATIAINKTIDYLRQLKRNQSINQNNCQLEMQSRELIKELSVWSTQELISQMDAVTVVKRLMVHLNNKEQKFCQLYFIEMVAPKEVAELLSISVDHVYVQKQRIMVKLKELIKKEKGI